MQLQGDCDEAHISWQGFLENGSVPWCRKIAVGVYYTVAACLGWRLTQSQFNGKELYKVKSNCHHSFVTPIIIELDDN